MSEFKKLQVAVSKQFDKMKKHELFRVEVNKDLLWETYLKSFPQGTNPILKERTEHDCQCCKSFIRAVGNVVAIIDKKVVSIWDIEGTKTFYDQVAAGMAVFVKQHSIDNVFLHIEPTAGVDHNTSLTDAGTVTWNHFFLKIPAANVCKEKDIGTKLSELRSSKDVLLRGLTELTVDSIETVQDLIAQNSLYRGEEHSFVLESFLTLKNSFDKLKTDRGRDLFCWSRLKTVPTSVSRIRNTSMGSLLTDLSEGKDLEYAVKAFETKVAPANYKRPTALVSKAMIAKAQEKIVELGLVSALERRYATIQDITINNILFADRSAKAKMDGDDIFATMKSSVAESPKTFNKVEEVGIEDFLTNILPKATSVELLLENRHASNLVSLIAPASCDAKLMFKWPNRFSWSYTGEVADSMKERVKAAGGSIVGDLCCRLAWEYSDDLDFHMVEPTGDEVYFGNRRHKSRCGGMLDVDANGIDGIVPHPVENIVYADKSKMAEGVYALVVHNYTRRSDGQGFEVEIDIGGVVHSISYARALRTQESVEVAQIKYSRKNGLEIIKSLPSSSTVKEMWGLSTQSFHKVNVLMMSPNYWDEKTVGNKHYFFMLDGCLNEGRARGFFNEFLNQELDAHRKVLEIVGSKMKTDESANQLSGVGFSSTQRNSVLCRVSGKFKRVVKVLF